MQPGPVPDAGRESGNSSPNDGRPCLAEPGKAGVVDERFRGVGRRLDQRRAFSGPDASALRTHADPVLGQPWRAPAAATERAPSRLRPCAQARRPAPRTLPDTPRAPAPASGPRSPCRSPPGPRVVLSEHPEHLRIRLPALVPRPVPATARALGPLPVGSPIHHLTSNLPGAIPAAPCHLQHPGEGKGGL